MPIKVLLKKTLHCRTNLKALDQHLYAVLQIQEPNTIQAHHASNLSTARRMAEMILKGDPTTMVIIMNLGGDSEKGIIIDE